MTAKRQGVPSEFRLTAPGRKDTVRAKYLLVSARGALAGSVDLAEAHLIGGINHERRWSTEKTPD